MNAGQLAALIAAVFFAAGVCVAAYALVKLARLLTVATGFLTGMREQTDVIVDQARAAIDRTNEQLDRTDAITANMNEVSANVAELTEHVSALAGLGRALAAGPVGKASAVAYGVRHALDLRRPGSIPGVSAPAVPAQRSAAEIGSAAVAAGPPESGQDAGVAAARQAGATPGRQAGTAVRQASSLAARKAGSAAARRAGSLAARGAGHAGKSLAARAIGRSAR
jgi:uncharacterized protein YoxC